MGAINGILMAVYAVVQVAWYHQSGWESPNLTNPKLFKNIFDLLLIFPYDRYNNKVSKWYPHGLGLWIREFWPHFILISNF